MKTIWAKRALTEDGWQSDVRLTMDADGRIASLASNCQAEGERFDILLPAVSNLHSHSFQRLMAGLTESRHADGGDSFWTWRELMYRFIDQLTPEHIESVAAFVQMEMLEAGFANNTEFHYLHHQPNGKPYQELAETSERVISAAAQTGIGLTLLPVLYRFGGSDRRSMEKGQLRFGNSLDQFASLFQHASKAMRRLPFDCVLGVAPHSLRAIADEDLQAMTQLAGDAPIHMHLAEQPAEVDEIQAALGKRPVEWVLENVPISKQWCFIHCTQMLPHETDELARSSATVGVCPITESNLGDGIFDAVRFMNAGGRLGLGSDANVRISLCEEVRTLEYSQRLRDHSRAALATSEQSVGRRIFESIVSGGAQAAGRETGRLSVNKFGDLMALDGASIQLDGLSGDAILDQFLFAADERLITDVWAAGRHVVKQGLHSDRDRITENYRRVIHELRAKL